MRRVKITATQVTKIKTLGRVRRGDCQPAHRGLCVRFLPNTSGIWGPDNSLLWGDVLCIESLVHHWLLATRYQEHPKPLRQSSDNWKCFLALPSVSWVFRSSLAENHWLGHLDLSLRRTASTCNNISWDKSLVWNTGTSYVGLLIAVKPTAIICIKICPKHFTEAYSVVINYTYSTARIPAAPIPASPLIVGWHWARDLHRFVPQFLYL